MKQRICQSCGMSMPTDDLLGTHGNGCLCTEYCYHCFQKGFFTNSSLEEQIELNIQPESLNAFNKASGTHFTKEEAAEGLHKFLPTLKRWMPIKKQAEWVLEQCGYIILSTVSENGYPRPVAIDILRHTGISIYNPQIQISAESETKRSIFREKDKTKRSKKESAQHSKSRNKSFVMTSVSAL